MTRAGGREGLFAGLQNSAATLLAMGQTRLELLGIEIETEKLRALRMLLLAQALIFCAGVAAVLVVALLVLLLWEQRLAVVAVFSLLFVIGAVFSYRALMRMIDPPGGPFAATLAEFQEDIRRLKAAAGHAGTPD